jgi:hypothetical protein
MLFDKKKNFVLFSIIITLFSICIFSCGISNYSKNVSKKFIRKIPEWEKDTLENCIIYYLPGSYAEEKISVLKTKISADIHHISSLMDTNGFNIKVHYFLVDNNATIKLLNKQGGNGKAYPFSHTVLCIYSPNISAVSAHEPFHVFSINAWGLSSQWIMEGAACYADSLWWNYPLNNLAAYFKKNNRLIPLEKLTTRFRKYPQKIAYPQLGSFIQYLCETYGKQKFIEFWKKKDPNLVFQKTLQQLENEWLLGLTNYLPIPGKYD